MIDYSAPHHPAGPLWAHSPHHRRWLLNQADRLFDFFERYSLDPAGGFHELDDDGAPLRDRPVSKELHATTRMVHCGAIGHLMGRPGSARLINHGLDYLWRAHRDGVHGGYFWALGKDGPSIPEKLAYGHAFVLLAAASASLAGHPQANALFNDVSAILDQHFWDENHGAASDRFSSDWGTLDAYRGQNANMHLVEALMTAYEVRQDKSYIQRANRIATLLIRRHTADNHWRLPEHFTSDWLIDADFSGDPMFRPPGSTPGHWLEWARLLMQLWETGKRAETWMPSHAARLFSQAIQEGWDRQRGGFYYTVDWQGQPLNADRYWWPACEGIGAATVLNQSDPSHFYEIWYRRIWDFTASHFIDHQRGGWYPQISAQGLPSSNPFYGKPDIYHALQACLIPLCPPGTSITKAARDGKILT